MLLLAKLPLTCLGMPIATALIMVSGHPNSQPRSACRMVTAWGVYGCRLACCCRHGVQQLLFDVVDIGDRAGILQASQLVWSVPSTTLTWPSVTVPLQVVWLVASVWRETIQLRASAATYMATVPSHTM
jgi:hypothetical protein